jgi:hypothetical protein
MPDIILLQSLRALIKFSREHEGENKTLEEILFALEKDDIKAAKELFQTLPNGPHGWHDWFPPVVYEHENPEYVAAVFEALAIRWLRLMGSAIGERVPKELDRWRI